MEFSQLKQEVYLQFIFKIIIYKKLLEKSYKFLGEILKWYDTLDQPVVEDEQYQGIFKLCDYASMFRTDTTGRYIIFCKKLSRNLLLLKDYYNDDFLKGCSNLYVWLYFEIKKNSIPNNITENIFKELTKFLQSKRSKLPCPYFNFNEKHHEPINLIKLRIFNDNVDTFQNMFKGIVKSDDCSVKRYVYKCIEIYRAMNSNYCSSSVEKTQETQNSCDIISRFNNLYKLYIFNKQGITHNFPELSSDISLNDIDGCPVEETEPNPNPDKSQHDTPTRGGVSTALSAMVGIPPFLALIYKVNIIHT
ncbi:hypothetical protein PVIIG_05206 [Plasmodium vivax India VII]|uniref:Uncharacterized protein n=1 Tax=Plasmodium vivax India VII TaxID=1077284 RepID=A0A0J9UUU5_PLAVI|nr:hypothetical protein PVIIG_05206 [Plasmodium vivax India VII]